MLLWPMTRTRRCLIEQHAGCFLVQLAVLDVVARHIDCAVPAHESGGRAPVTGAMTMFKGAKGIHRKMADQKTVYDVTYDLLRSLGLTTVFGNPGSTEETFLKNFPDDFSYVLGLQEASVMAMADGFAQSTGKPALVNVHTAAGTGNAMGNLIAAYRGNTPLIVTAGQQTREMLLCEPYLTNLDETLLPQPWVKWAYQPARAQDVPAAFMRAYAVALQPPAGPVFLSIPLDDWDKPALGPAVVRTVSHRVGPDAERLRTFADRINRAQRPMLVFGPEVDRSGAWDAAVAFAEKVGAPVYGSPLPDRASFPDDHRRRRKDPARSRPGDRHRGTGLPLLPLCGRRLSTRGHRSLADHQRSGTGRGR